MSADTMQTIALLLWCLAARAKIRRLEATVISLAEGSRQLIDRWNKFARSTKGG